MASIGYNELKRAFHPNQIFCKIIDAKSCTCHVMTALGHILEQSRGITVTTRYHSTECELLTHCD